MTTLTWPNWQHYCVWSTGQQQFNHNKEGLFLVHFGHICLYLCHMKTSVTPEHQAPHSGHYYRRAGRSCNQGRYFPLWRDPRLSKINSGGTCGKVGNEISNNLNYKIIVVSQTSTWWAEWHCGADHAGQVPLIWGLPSLEGREQRGLLSYLYKGILVRFTYNYNGRQLLKEDGYKLMTSWNERPHRIQ